MVFAFDDTLILQRRLLKNVGKSTVCYFGNRLKIP